MSMEAGKLETERERGREITTARTKLKVKEAAAITNKT